MKQTTDDTKRLEALHRLYYALAHHVLPEIILSENVDKLLQPNPAGDGLLSEAGTGAIPSVAHQGDSGTAHAEAQDMVNDSLHMAEQNEESLEMGLSDFKDDLFSFGNTLDPADTDEYPLEDAANDFDTDAAHNEYDATDENYLEEEEDEDEEADVDGLIAELESMLELHTLGQAYDNPDEAFLADTWREAWFQTELEDYPANTGYTLRRINQLGFEIIQFSFPKPIGITAAWQAIAIRQTGNPYRYFTLEKTVSDDKENAVLAEWATGDMHKNYGINTHEVSDPQVFLNMVLAKVA